MTAVASATMPSRTANHRVRVMLWFHTRRCVPVSSSRATSGAPQNTPTTTGSANSTALPIWYSRAS
jgi:hypothetical protein